MPPVGFTFPFARTTGSLGYLETTNDSISAVKENLRSLLLTNRGERVMHSDFGCNLSEFLFENIVGDHLREIISDRIRSQVARWMPFVSVIQLDVLFPEDNLSISEHAIGIRIEFGLSSRPDLFATIDVSVTQ